VKAFVINLKRRADRLAHMQHAVPAALDVEYTTDWSIPSDGRSMTIEALRGFDLFPWRVESDNRLWARPLKKGEIGCAIAHWACWQRSLTCDADLFAYFEDDACFVDAFMTRLHDGLQRLSAVDPDWDLLYLGRYPLAPDAPVVPGIVRPGFSYSTFAYVLTRRAVSKVLATNFDRAIIPVDELLPALYVDHPRADVRRRYPRILRAYAFEPPLVGSFSREVSGTDTEDSDFIEERADACMEERADACVSSRSER